MKLTRSQVIAIATVVGSVLTALLTSLHDTHSQVPASVLVLCTLIVSLCDSLKGNKDAD